MNTVLPFDGFLDVLRAKGYAVGLREHFALASLLDRWEGTNRGEFRDALAALVGRSDEEVQGIRRLFNDFYRDHAEAPAAALTPAEPSPLQDGLRLRPRVPTFRSSWIWAGAALAVVIVLGFLVWRLDEPTGSTPPAPPVAAASPAAPAAPEPATASMRYMFDWRILAGAFGAAFLVALLVFWILKSREARRHWLRQLWSARFSALPGPHHFSLTVRGRPAGLARADVEDAATFLGRVFATEAPARQLDVRRSVQGTLRQGLFPRVVFKQRPVIEAILVFQDVSQDMEMWRPKVERFLTDVARQGVALDRYYFDGDIRRVTRRPHRAAVPFDVVMRSRLVAPVLVISTGAALAAVLDQADDRWLIALRNRLRRSWLSPLVDVRLWPTELGTLPINVWPMTRRGLSQTAKDLAGVQGDAPAALKQRIASEGLVTQDGIERIKRLASLVPYPTVDLLEVLRFRFAPDVSDAVVVHLFAETGSQAAPVLRLSDEELHRCLNAVRGETPRLEASVRQVIVETLRDSEPPAGSAAHLRWQAALSLQELVLADLQRADTTRPLAALRELGEGPTWEETRRAARLVPSAPTLTEKIAAALGTDVGGSDSNLPPSRVEQAAGRAPWPWLWPGVREIVPAAVLASLLVMVAGIGRVIGVGVGLGNSSQLLTITKPAGGTILTRGIICGTRGADCSVERPKGEAIELTPEADAGFLFAGFTGDCAPAGRIVMTGPRSCGAAFAQVLAPPATATQRLTISPMPRGGTVEGVDIICGTQGPVCSADYPAGVPVDLHPTADPGFTFMGFLGDCVPLGRTQMTGPRELRAGAMFSPDRAVPAGVPQPDVDSRGGSPQVVVTQPPVKEETPGIPRRTGEAWADYLVRVQRITLNLQTGRDSLAKQNFALAIARFRLVEGDQQGYQGVEMLIADAVSKQRAAFDQAMTAGQNNEQLSRFADARKWYQYAIAVDPSDPVARERNAALLHRVNEDADGLFTAATVLRKRGENDRAMQLLQQILLMAPGDEIRAKVTGELQILSTDEAFVKTRIQEVLKAYCAAFEALDPDAVRVVSPRIDFDALQRQMKQYTSAQCTFGDPKYVSLDTKAGSAKVEVDLKRGYVFIGSARPETYEQIATMMLSRSSPTSPWLIDTVAFNPKK